MSEKRFILDDSYLIDTENQNILGYDVSFDLVDLLNSLSEENERLKSDRRKDAKEFSALFKQNLDLHLKNKNLKQENDKLKKIYNKLEEAIEKRGYEDIDDFW